MSLYSDVVKVVEVAPRDGLQNEARTWTVSERVELIERLTSCGFTSIEGGSFVSPKAIPQMVQSEDVFQKLKNLEVDLSFLVPNEKGLTRAVEAGVKSIAIFTATSESFTQKNIGMTVEKSLDVFKKVIPAAKQKNMRVRGYISTAFGCPFEGKQDPNRAVELTQELFKMGCEEVSIGDTIGVAHPQQVKDLFGRLQSEMDLRHIAGHFHDTRGSALSNIMTALEMGVRIFDAAVGGLGGCPYAPGSSGNVASEEVIWLLEGFGLKTNVALEKLLETATWVETKAGRPLKGKFFLSHPRLLHYG